MTGDGVEGQNCYNYILITFPQFVFTAYLCVLTYILFGRDWAGYIVQTNKYMYTII